MVSAGQLLNQAPAGPNRLSLNRPSQITVSRCGISITMPGIIIVARKSAKMKLRPTNFIPGKGVSGRDADCQGAKHGNQGDASAVPDVAGDAERLHHARLWVGQGFQYRGNWRDEGQWRSFQSSFCGSRRVRLTSLTVMNER